MRVLLFADDSALVVLSAEEIQTIVDAFSDAFDQLRITWMAKVTNHDILERIALPSMEYLLIRRISVGRATS